MSQRHSGSAHNKTMWRMISAPGGGGGYHAASPASKGILNLVTQHGCQTQLYRHRVRATLCHIISQT